MFELIGNTQKKQEAKGVKHGVFCFCIWSVYF